MGRALVLNASYEPLCVVPARRAVVLVLTEKADILHGTGAAFRSESLSVPVPSVIRLRTYVRVPVRRKVALSRRAVLARDDHECQYCGAVADSIDHVVPRSRGGAHQWDNVVAACRRCNAAKGDRLLADIAMTLRRRPRVPHETTWVIVAVGEVPDHWVPYLEPTRLATA
ncbi:MAG TPA: HNH endonuclease [Acidimicrobiales bacterium]|nr:HNH endonuclease [Acidimicrobiales bacterium]